MKSIREIKQGGSLTRLMKDESGVGTIEIVLILVVLIGLVVIFRDSIERLLAGIFASINSMTGGITGG